MLACICSRKVAVRVGVCDEIRCTHSGARVRTRLGEAGPHACSTHLSACGEPMRPAAMQQRPWQLPALAMSLGVRRSAPAEWGPLTLRGLRRLAPRRQRGAARPRPPRCLVRLAADGTPDGTRREVC